MDYKTVSSTSTIKEELLKNPHKADEFDRVWKQIYNYYYYTRKFDIHKIKSQERWDEFFKNIDKKLLKSIKLKAVLDPELWVYGSVSQDKDLQTLLHTMLPTPDHEEKDEHEHDASTNAGHDGPSHLPEPGDAATTPASPTIASEPATPLQSTSPIIITRTTPVTPAAPIRIVTSTRAPVNQVLAGIDRQNTAPLGIITPQMAKNPSLTQPIQVITQTRTPISTIIPTPITSPSSGDPEPQSFIITSQIPAPVMPPPVKAPQPFILPPQRFAPMPTPSSAPHVSAPHGGAGNGSRAGVPGIPGGIGGIASTAANAGINMLPGGVVVTKIWKNKKIIAGLLVFLLFFFSTFFNDDKTLPAGAEPAINKTTEDTTNTVENPPDVAGPCLANPLLCEIGQIDSSSLIAQSDEKVVLGATSQDHQAGVKGLLDNILGDLLKSQITYSITASYPAGADDIIVTDPIPSSALFITASGICHVKKDVNGKVIEVWWSVKENQGVNQADLACRSTGASITPTVQAPTGALTPTTTGKINVAKYSGGPYFLPPSTGPSDTQFSQEDLNNANTLGAAVSRIQPYLLKKLSPEYADPFLAVMWTMAIEGSGANPYFWNCNDVLKGKENISKGCRGWYSSGDWQVGYGIQVSQAASHLAQDFKEIYGSSDAPKVQEVGNKVIRGGGISSPTTMPSKSIEQIVQEAGAPGAPGVERPTTDTEAAAQQIISILLMDPAIGAAAVAQEVAGDIGTNWANRMRGFGDYYVRGLDPSNPLFSNRIKLLAEKYTGSSSGGDPSGGTSFAPMTFRNRILPLQKNKVLTSSAATIEVIGGRGTSSATNSATGVTNTTTTGSGCTKVSNPPGDGWAAINALSADFLEKVNEINQSALGVCVPVNLVKALVYEESGGAMLEGNGAGYSGIMQVGAGSWCDHAKYDIRTKGGNIGCGIEHLAHTYQECNNSWEGAVTAYYAGHCIPNGAHDNVADGGSGETDFQYRDRIIGRWKELDALSQ